MFTFDLAVLTGNCVLIPQMKLLKRLLVGFVFFFKKKIPREWH